MKRAAKETRVRAGDYEGGGGDGGGGGGGWWLPATRERGNGMERARGRAEVSGKLNLAQDVTAPGNTGASVR